MSGKKKLLASFSGGLTSAFMAKWLLDNCAGEYEILPVFANTGQEHEKTLEFVNACDRHFGFNTVWVEAVVYHGERRGSTHRVVTFETASRKGEPFEDMIRKYGIPNKAWPQCTRELKLRPIRSYADSIGWTDYFTAIGIRTDEARRVSSSAEASKIIYPLIDMIPTDKQDVNAWWEQQPFTLGLQEHQGNCTWCWKKSLNKHMRLIQESPEIYEFPRRMEKLYGLAGTNPNGLPRVFFRENRSTDDLFALADLLKAEASRQSSLFDMDANNGCAESCEIFTMERQ